MKAWTVFLFLMVSAQMSGATYAVIEKASSQGTSYFFSVLIVDDNNTPDDTSDDRVLGEGVVTNVNPTASNVELNEGGSVNLQDLSIEDYRAVIVSVEHIAPQEKGEVQVAESDVYHLVIAEKESANPVVSGYVTAFI